MDRRGRRSGCRLAGLAVVAALVVQSGYVSAEPQQDPDWPCIQRQVPELSYGLLWAGPPLEPYFASWDNQLEREQVVRLAANIAVPEERVRSVLAIYAAEHDGIGEAERAKLFAGTFELIEARYSNTIDAIKRYTRGQRLALKRISELLQNLDELLQKPEENAKQINATRAELDFTRQVFDDRRRALTAVCEQPVLLRQRLGFVNRTMQATE